MRVKVTYEGEISHRCGVLVAVKDEAGHTHWYDDKTVSITELEPENWPPQLGDVWEIKGKFFHFMNEGNPNFYESRSRGNEYVTEDYVKSANPVLKHRG